MLSQILRQRVSQLCSLQSRAISSKAVYQKDTKQVKLRGKFLQGRQQDLPTLIWLSDLIEPSENFEQFFARKNNKVLDVRNVWLLDSRNQGDSDHHDSYDMEEMGEDIVRFMNDNKITMATIGGHGFGAKLATATASNNLNRFTGVICLEGGPLDHRYYEAYQELHQYVEATNQIKLENLAYPDAVKKVSEAVSCAKWRKIFLQNLSQEKGPLQWKLNLSGLAKEMKKQYPSVAVWRESYGLWPGQALALFAANSRWVHLSTNTLPFYNVFPRLQNEFPGNLNIFASELEGPLTHWIHENPASDIFALSQRFYRFLRFKDGAHVLLADKTEAGWYFVPDRGQDPNTNTGDGEYNPEHVHHNYLYTDAYEKSRQARGKEAATHGQFLPSGKFSSSDKW